MAGDGTGFKCVLSLSIKQYPKLKYEVSVMCSWHFCSKNDVLPARGGLYSFGLIPTLDPKSRI